MVFSSLDLECPNCHEMLNCVSPYLYSYVDKPCSCCKCGCGITLREHRNKKGMVTKHYLEQIDKKEVSSAT